MNPPSSSADQTPTYSSTPGYQVCVLVSFFWGYNPNLPFTDEERFADSVSEYIDERFGVCVDAMNLLHYYNDNVPEAMRKARQPYQWNEDMLAFCIANLIQDSQEYDNMTSISLVSQNILS